MTRVAAAVFLGSFAAAIAAEEPPPAAPLSSTKEQLKQLRKDQTVEKSGAGTPSLRGSLPSLTGPTPGQQGIEAPAPSGSQEAQKPGMSTNWLLDRYDSLDPKRRTPTAARERPAPALPGGEQLDPSDPDYFVKQYERQRREAADKEAAREDRFSAKKPDSKANPFTPFLQDWLSGSPVGNIVRDSLNIGNSSEAAKAAAIPGGTTADVATRFDGFAASGERNAEAPVAASAGEAAPVNPYLQALTAPSVASREASAPVAAGAYSQPNVPPRPTSSGQPPLIVPRNDIRRALPAGADDDKKYFPQLKKF